jgi:hypothetical protein
MHRTLKTTGNFTKHLIKILNVFLFSIPASLAQQGAVDGEWQAYGADNGSTKYTALSVDQRWMIPIRSSIHSSAMQAIGLPRLSSKMASATFLTALA